MWLITSDLHLTDRPKDAARFGLFKWLAKQQDKYQVRATFILGDITDKKDNHSSELVNRIVDELTGLRPPVYVLMGNHDYINSANPFFRFLSYIEDIHFITKPTKLLEFNVAMIPHQPDQDTFDAACDVITSQTRVVMVHQSFTGAQAETGLRLSGLQWPPVGFKGRGLVTLAGDVHTPQRLPNGLTYIGAPYHVHFGDDSEPRVLLLDGAKQTDLHYPCPCKWSLTVHDADDLQRNEKLKAGDQIKIKIELAREEAVQWNEYKQRILAVAKELKLEVFGVEVQIKESKRRERPRLGQLVKVKTPEDVFNAFCMDEKVASNIKSAGFDVLNTER